MLKGVASCINTQLHMSDHVEVYPMWWISQGHMQNRRQATFSWPILYMSMILITVVWNNCLGSKYKGKSQSNTFFFLFHAVYVSDTQKLQRSSLQHCWGYSTFHHSPLLSTTFFHIWTRACIPTQQKLLSLFCSHRHKAFCRISLSAEWCPHRFFLKT